jgi:hypothetical protein
MKLQIKVVAVGLLCALGVAPSAARAEDDNVYDGKTYPGSLCDAASNVQSFAKTAPFYYNSAPAGATVFCPIIQDSWQNNAGLTYSKMSIFNNVAGQTFTCTENSYNVFGTFIGSRSFSTTTQGTSAQYFFNGTYLNTTAEGYMMIQCTMPQYGRIWSYLVQERA